MLFDFDLLEDREITEELEAARIRSEVRTRELAMRVGLCTPDSEPPNAN